MPTSARIELDPVGSHLILSFPYDSRLVAAVRTLPQRIWQRHQRSWAVPLLPQLLEPLRGLCLAWPQVSISAQAGRRLETLGALPAATTGLVHFVPDDRAPAFVLCFGYDPELVADVRFLPERRYERELRRWWVHYLDDGVAALRHLLRRHPELAVTAEAARALADPPVPVCSPPPTRAAVQHQGCAISAADDEVGDPWLVFCRRCHGGLLPLPESLNDALLDLGERWALPLWGELADELIELVADQDVDERTAVLDRLGRLAEQQHSLDGMSALSAAREAELFVTGLGGTLRPFQRAAVAYALRARRTFLADEQGLGKTVEALAALHAADACRPWSSAPLRCV